ncbi:MAG: hypothetical protein FWH26_01405 [Oscillospiraceae bacterium]|nr:hypothetical protein [Oscillospiraceae bacterium]
MSTQTADFIEPMDELQSAFRELMALPAGPETEARLREELHGLMSAILGRADFKGNPKLRHMLLACRLRLRLLLHRLAAAQPEARFAPQACELRELSEDLSTAADLLLSPLGRVVLFTSSHSVAEAACAPRDFSWLLLEMLCNAACHTQGEEIRVTLDKRGAGARETPCLLLSVASEGQIELPRLHAAAARPGSGVSAMLRTAWLHRGSLLWYGDEACVRCVLRLPLLESYGSLLPVWDPPDFVQLLCDQLSPVYTAFSPCVGV